MINENTPTLETERLILRKFTIDDSDAFFELMLMKKLTLIFLGMY